MGLGAQFGGETVGDFPEDNAGLWPAVGLVDAEIRFLTLSKAFMQRRVSSREFKLEALKLVTERGLAVM